MSQSKVYKILISGPVGAGKSTAIGTLSDTPVVATEELASDETRDLKQNTTVAMDYGVLKIPGGDAVHLYGTPGQDRFDYMWEVLAEGALGLILLVGNNNPDPMGFLDNFIKAFDDLISRTGLAVGITNTDRKAEPRLSDYQAFMMERNLKHPVFLVDARDRKDMQILLQALLYSIK